MPINKIKFPSEADPNIHGDKVDKVTLPLPQEEKIIAKNLNDILHKINELVDEANNLTELNNKANKTLDNLDNAGEQKLKDVANDVLKQDYEEIASNKQKNDIFTIDFSKPNDILIEPIKTTGSKNPMTQANMLPLYKTINGYILVFAFNDTTENILLELKLISISNNIHTFRIETLNNLNMINIYQRKEII